MKTLLIIVYLVSGQVAPVTEWSVHDDMVECYLVGTVRLEQLGDREDIIGVHLARCTEISVKEAQEKKGNSNG